jgi:hypothetical protein
MTNQRFVICYEPGRAHVLARITNGSIWHFAGDQHARSWVIDWTQAHRFTFDDAVSARAALILQEVLGSPWEVRVP